jgi:hypothetical protein
MRKILFSFLSVREPSFFVARNDSHGKETIYFTYDHVIHHEYFDRQELINNYKSLGSPLFHDHDQHSTTYMHDLCVRDHAAGQQRAGDPGTQAHCQAVHQVQSFSSK